ncbi:hypothetical protein KEM55_002675 [Ascosphaera atra]|nr:hypothetical protein KEM55_002675 [Ascosphaera atra]
MRAYRLLGALLAPLAGNAYAATIRGMSNDTSLWHAADMFTTGIEWNDEYWDEDAGFLLAASSNPGRFDVRHSGWYVPQLLARNAPGDVDRAVRIFDSIIAGQYDDPSKQWYGDYQHSPSEPQPGTAEYANIAPYKAWDPNWRVFIGCAWVVALNDYGHLLPNATYEKVKKSLHLAAKGDLYRVGGVDGDNLYPAYSNPWVMRTILQSWIGTQTGDKNLTEAGEKFAQDLYDLWSRHKTLSEYNSPTYSGVAMWALALWSQYAPKNSKLKRYAPEMLIASWQELGELYNPNLKNVAGPWDRTYGYNLKDYVGLIGAVIWGSVGRRYAPIPSNLAGAYHKDDFCLVPLIALSMPEMVKYLPEMTKNKFTQFSGEHMYHAQAISPPFDSVPRNISTWMSENITIGAETVSEAVVGGPSKNAGSFNPAVVQWAIDDYQVGCVTHYPTQSSIHAVAAPRTLNITYPNATASDAPIMFNFLLSGIDNPQGFNVTGLEHLPGLNLSISTNASPNYTIIYDTSQSVNEFIFYNITYTMPEDFKGQPYFNLEVQ